MTSRQTASTPAAYLASLAPEARKELARVRALIRRHLPKGYAETMQYGMITYVVPLQRYPAGYLNKKDVPLPYLSLGAQKRHLAVYLMCLSGDPKREQRFRDAWTSSGKKLDFGKSCLRFQSADDLALDVLAQTIASTPPADHIAHYEATRSKR